MLAFFLQGSALVNVPGPTIQFAGNSAWVSVLVTSLVGALLLACSLYLHRKHRGIDFIEYSRRMIGPRLTVVISIPIAVYLLLMATWIMRDAAVFMESSMMSNTPPYVFYFLLLAVAAQTIHAGFEVMARMFVLFLCIVLFFLIVVLLFSLPYYYPSMLLPVFPEGLKPMLHGMYFLWGFPYSDIIVIVWILFYVDRQKSSGLGWKLYAALAANVLAFTLVTICTIMIFGPMAEEMNYPLYAISRLIEIGEFFQRIESIVSVSLIVGFYMKVTIALFALHDILGRLLRLSDRRVLVYPLALVCLMLSLTMLPNQAEFKFNVNAVWPLINQFFAVLPVMIVVAATIARRASR